MQTIPELRPLGIGEILDAAIRLYRRNFVALSMMAGLLIVPIGLLEVLLLFVVSSLESTSTAQESAIVTQVVTIIYNLASYWIVGAITFFMLEVYLGRVGDFRASLKVGWNKFASLWGAGIVQGLAIGVPVGIFACVATATGVFGMVLMLIVAIPVAIALGTRWSIFVPAIIKEGLGAMDGLHSSWDLTRDHFWRILGISLLSFALLFFIAGIPSLLVGYVVELFSLSISPTIVLMLQQTLTRLGSIITLPVSLALRVVIYYDLRVRKEGFDLTLRVEAMSTDGQES